MKIKKIFSSKRAAGLLIILSLFAITACGSTQKSAGTIITLASDEAVKANIVESFDKEYYDKDELQQKILAEVADYNRNNGEGKISVEKITVEDNAAMVQMTYAKATDYADFNDNIFFVGSPMEAKEAGYELNIVLSGIRDENETVGESDILSMTNYRILITDVEASVVLNGKAVYCSSNVAVSKNLKAIALAEETEEVAYIIFK